MLQPHHTTSRVPSSWSVKRWETPPHTSASCVPGVYAAGPSQTTWGQTAVPRRVQRQSAPGRWAVPGRRRRRRQGQHYELPDLWLWLPRRYCPWQIHHVCGTRVGVEIHAWNLDRDLTRMVRSIPWCSQTWIEDLPYYICIRYCCCCCCCCR